MKYGSGTRELLSPPKERPNAHWLGTSGLDFQQSSPLRALGDAAMKLARANESG
jgi:hypothetical protein